jgi:hypothetical protein
MNQWSPGFYIMGATLLLIVGSAIAPRVYRLLGWEEDSAVATATDFHAMHCKRVGYTSKQESFDRCESEEALCFAQGDGGLMCIWKDLK